MSRKKIIGIYKLTSPSGRVYIGQSRNIKQRMIAHREYKKQVNQPKLFRSYEKHGYENHVSEIIYILPNDISQGVLNAYEIYFMQAYIDCGVDLLNVRRGGSHGAHSKESREKIGRSKLGNKNMLGKTHSEETRKKISDAVRKSGKITWNRGLPWNKETKIKMSQARMGKEPWNKGVTGYGKNITDEGRHKMSEASKTSWANIKKQGIKVSLSGEESPQAKLTTKKVQEIIELILMDEISMSKIAELYGVSNGAVGYIKSGRNWKGVMPEKRKELTMFTNSYKYSGRRQKQ